MKHLLTQGEISRLMPDNTWGGWSGEVHLIKHENKKYVVRRCTSLKKAKYYEFLNKLFEKDGFLPKFLGRHGKDVFYEYIEGRDLRENEKMEIFEKIGEIMAKINKKIPSKENNLRFNSLIKELETGNYTKVTKAQFVRKKRGIKEVPKKQLSKIEAKKLRKKFKELKNKFGNTSSYEMVDPTPGNFRTCKNKVYLVDIEAIKDNRAKGYGISKFFLNWGNIPKRKKAFLEGYNKFNSSKFLTKDYNGFIDLNFLIIELNFQAQTGKDTKKTKERLLEIIN